MPAQLPPDPDGQPMGATVSSDGSGVVSRCWAPRAENVWVAGDFNGWQMGEAARLNRRGGFWVGLFPGVGAGARYKSASREHCRRSVGSGTRTRAS